MHHVENADCLDFLAALKPDCIDSFVQDPPYGLAFMGKGWDYAVPGPEFFEAQLRVAKPGAHLVAFGGTRTYHLLACAIEDAGWELRDSLMWLYGSGFPKSADVAKAIDAHAFGVWLDANGHREEYRRQVASYKASKASPEETKALHLRWHEAAGAIDTDDAQKWEGWGTALKPAWEPIILARKPFKATVAANVLAHGTGALNVDACRVATNDNLNGGGYSDNRETSTNDVYGEYARMQPAAFQQPTGRWPANVVLDPEAGALLDAQTGELKSGKKEGGKYTRAVGIHDGGQRADGEACYNDAGGASRFFYCAKATKKEREAGLENFDPRIVNDGRKTSIDNAYQRGDTKRRNTHPTVKPVALMRWLVRLITPPGGIVCDPFCGSGSTGCAAVLEGFDFVGIEREAELAALADARIAHHAQVDLTSI